MTWYWNKVIIVVALIAAIVLLSVFGKNVPTGVLAMLQGALGTALAMMLPPTEKTKTGLTMPPPASPPEDNEGKQP